VTRALTPYPFDEWLIQSGNILLATATTMLMRSTITCFALSQRPSSPMRIADRWFALQRNPKSGGQRREPPKIHAAVPAGNAVPSTTSSTSSPPIPGAELRAEWHAGQRRRFDVIEAATKCATNWGRAVETITHQSPYFSGFSFYERCSIAQTMLPKTAPAATCGFDPSRPRASVKAPL